MIIKYNNNIVVYYMEQSLPQLYIERDVKLQLIPEETIIKHLKKLNYYNIDIEKLKNDYITDYLVSEVKKNNYYLNDEFQYIINTTLNTIINSEKYINYIKYLDYCLERSNLLMNYNNINDFYNNCTNDELLYLGY